MAKGDIKRVAKEVGTELGGAYTETKKYIRKNVRRPQTSPQMAFALLPPQYYRPVQKPRPVRKVMKRRRRR